MKSKFVIIASQEYDVANHQGLWKEISEISSDDVIVVNIPADYIVSTLRGKSYRINDAKKTPRVINNRLKIVRPLLTFRPELLPGIGKKVFSKQFWESVSKAVPDIMECHVNLLVYNAFWIKLLLGTHQNMSIGYYLFDEVRSQGNTNAINRRRCLDDDFACNNSDIIFTMTQLLADSRKSYNKNTIVVGNGASAQKEIKSKLHIKNSVAFIGNFRNWIDKNLLEELILSMNDVFFAFVGPIESDMHEYLEHLLNKYSNTLYMGKVDKNRINDVYQLFDVVIVPYLQNDFIRATRPIKIVESVIAGTPVVTIPMDGYQQCEFIRFATDVESFTREIRKMISHPIDKKSESHVAFCLENSWERKAKLIIDSFKSIC